jgi:hypothetical protein
MLRGYITASPLTVANSLHSGSSYVLTPPLLTFLPSSSYGWCIVIPMHTE